MVGLSCCYSTSQQCNASGAICWMGKSKKIQVFVERHPSALNLTLPAFDAECGLRAYHLLIDVCCRSPRSAANPSAAAAAVDRLDRQTDGRRERRTDTRPLHRPPRTVVQSRQ